MASDNNFDFSKLTGDEKLGKLWEKLCHVDSQSNVMNDYLKDLKFEMQTMDSRIKKCEDIYCNLIDEVNSLRTTVNDLQQAALNCNLIIRNVGEIEKNEIDLLTVTQLIIGKMNISVPVNITAVKRLGRKVDGQNKSRQILVSLHTPEEKDRLMVAKKRTAIKASDVKFESVSVGKYNEIIYFDEQLTKQTADLYYATRQLRKRQVIKHTWVRQGKVYVRKRDGDQPIRITDMLKLTELTKRRFNSTPNESDEMEEMAIDDTVYDVYNAKTFISNDAKRTKGAAVLDQRGGGGAIGGN